MSGYVDLVMERRSHFGPDGKPVCNCCQTVVSVFARALNYDEEACLRAATYFRGGMQMGAVCGAVTGALMVLGLAGLKDPAVSDEFLQRIRASHGNMVNCADLLRDNAEKGGEKMPFCNALIRECVSLAEEILRAKNIPV